jgi:hypothetical protein
MPQSPKMPQPTAVEKNTIAKIIRPDIRFINHDGLLTVSWLCAPQHRCEEAYQWFARARGRMDGSGQRPWRSIVDYEEALMYARRAAPGDAELALPLIDAALPVMREIGMTGWVRRAEDLRASLASAE